MKFLIIILFCSMIVRQATSYYFYNDKTKQVISTSTLNVPNGFRIMPPPKTIKFNRETFTRDLHCQDMGFSCTEKYNYSSTYQFECANDSNCPKSFICCPQKCFTHRVCTIGTSKLVSRKPVKPLSRTIVNPDNGRCEKWPYSCYQPYPAYLTYKFKCDYDGQCPSAYKCCQQTCFSHKICSKSYSGVEELRRADNRSTKTNENVESHGTEANGTGDPDKFFQSISTTDLATITKQEETVTEQDKTIFKEEQNPTTLEENNPSKEEHTSVGEDEKFSSERVTEQEASSSQTRDPNSIDPEYPEYYEDDNDEEEQR